MSEDKQAKKYFENMPYGNDAKSSEIHGKENQQVINGMVSDLVSKYDEAMKVGDKKTASKFSSVIKQISGDLDNLKEIKKEFAVNYGGGTGGKNLFSNWTNLKQFDLPFWLEGGKISFDEQMKPLLSVIDAADNTQEITKRIEDITEDWVIKGSEESEFMKMQQNALKQRNTMGEPLDFDVDWQVDNILHNNDAWKVFAADKIGGRYFLQDYVLKNKDKVESGEITDDMLHPKSFNPSHDTRLHKYFSDRIKKSFDPNHLSPEELFEAKRLESMVPTKTNESTKPESTIETTMQPYIDSGNFNEDELGKIQKLELNKINLQKTEGASPPAPTKTANTPQGHRNTRVVYESPSDNESQKA